MMYIINDQNQFIILSNQQNYFHLKVEADLNSDRVRSVDIKIQCLFVIIVRARQCQVPAQSYIVIAGHRGEPS